VSHRRARNLAKEDGFKAVYLGSLKKARLLEPLAMVWIVLARHRGLGRNFALNIIHRPTTFK
jgi:predicted dinucleotide-binding enzyme